MSDQPTGDAPGRYGDAPVTTLAGPSAYRAPDPVRQALLDVRHEVAKAVVGQDATVTGLLIALLSQGHVLLEGVPGVAKTLLVRALSAALSLTPRGCSSRRTSCRATSPAPWSMTRHLGFSFREGPCSPTSCWPTRSTARRRRRRPHSWRRWRNGRSRWTARPAAPDPFLVAATQNPVEYEGTYPLPEAQLDRFLLKLTMPLPDRRDEMEVIRRHAAGFDPRDLAAAGVRAVAGAADLERARQAVATVAVEPEIIGYIVDLARATRSAPSFQLGVSPRGATALLDTAKAWAWLSGRS